MVPHKAVVMTTNTRTTVLGLGSMGAALATALLRAGVPTTVWNRTPGRADALVADGAIAAPDLASAISDSEVVIVCLRDHDAARELLGSIDPAAYDGRTIVHLSSSTPGDGRRTATWAAELGLRYLTGAIMVPTALVGGRDALFLYAGERAIFDEHVDLLHVLGGKADYLGADHGLAALHDVAMLEIFFAGLTAFLHASAMVTAQGVDAKTFLPYAQAVLGVVNHSITGLAADVDAASYPGTEDNLAMELSGLRHIVHTTAELGLDERLPQTLHDVAEAAVAAGHGEDSFSRVIEVLRG